MNTNANARRFSTPLVLIFGLLLAVVTTRVILAGGANAEVSRLLRQQHSLLTLRQRQRRAEYWASRHGLQYGVPKHAMAHAVAQMRAMESGRRGADIAAAASELASSGEFSGALPALPAFTPTWSFIGPLPMQQKSNFTGNVVGNPVPMTGRVSSIAADGNGDIVAGAASGGVWLSTNDGASFASIFDNGPTQAIGAVALDTTTTPSTI